ncbi:zinc finger protein ZFP2-like [Cylas formicarius]|uniref:zinc finger protein ZFP2-like n=1 Tax=Cylas formicarius TaxID=197179 RepID=UPI0029588EA1|nr:zinc finger protein ZFP2-like [Cylas formicarius]XP_060516483.1 zinc finger protein ZFP2-like [Cylas formicarius]
MKTEHLVTTNDPIWANSVEFLSSDDGLPVIGSCQVSSILQNLDSANVESNPQNTELIILNGNDYKIPLVDAPVDSHNNYIVLKESLSSETCNKQNASAKQFDGDLFEDMLYFVCNLCPFLCTKDTKITEHLETAHKNKTVTNKLIQLKCPACANNFYHRSSLKSHLLHDHYVSNSDLNLIVQAVMYYSNKDNKKHFKNHKISLRYVGKLEPPKLHNQSIQEDEYSDPEHFEAQFSKEVSNGAVPCPKVTLPQINVTTTNTEKLFKGTVRKTDIVAKPVPSKKCIIPLCKVRLNDVTKLNIHIGCHTDSGFKCLECNEKFMMWKPLSSHLWRVHKIDMELYSCDKCDYKTYSLSKMNNVHKLIHGDVKAFLCDICNKAFKNLKQLRNHKVVHKDKVDKVECEICSKCFSDKRTLKSHMDSVHKRIKPYLCNYCGYKGSSRASLRMHIRLHTGEKPFSCSLCSYSTADHNSLRRHKLRHTGQKPYKCIFCPYACIQTNTYKMHLKTKHPGMEKDLMFTCSLCQFRTVNKEMYSAHFSAAHKQTSSSDL